MMCLSIQSFDELAFSDGFPILLSINCLSAINLTLHFFSFDSSMSMKRKNLNLIIINSSQTNNSWTVKSINLIKFLKTFLNQDSTFPNFLLNCASKDVYSWDQIESKRVANALG